MELDGGGKNGVAYAVNSMGYESAERAGAVLCCAVLAVAVLRARLGDASSSWR
jgi:hypothetical protein